MHFSKKYPSQKTETNYFSSYQSNPIYSMSNLKKQLKKTNPALDSQNSDPKKSGKWTEEEDQLLQEIVPHYNERHWRKISQHMKGRSAIQCLHRWTKILKPGLVKGPWSAEEDNQLMVWVQEKGPIKWAQCALLIPGRSGKQCRERWFNNLNPNVKKGDWTPEEDDLIYKLYVNYGSSWSKIALHFKDRTENSIKNRFYSTIRKLYSDQKKLEKGKTVKKHLKKQEEKKEEPNQNQKILPEEESLKMTNKILINTLYNLLKASKVEHPPHINKIYSSGIYKKSRRYKRKPKKTLEIREESPQSLITKVSTNIKDEAYCSSESESDGNFENFLDSIEQTINKELYLRDISSFENLTLEQLQNKVVAFCNETPLKIEQNGLDGNKQGELEKILDLHIEKEINNGNKDHDQILDNVIQEEILQNCEEENKESDKKMVLLLQQMQTLENMLTKTRQELLSLENSLQVPEKNDCDSPERIALKEEDSFIQGYQGFNDLPAINEWSNCKRKASVYLEDYFDFPNEGKKLKRFGFMEEEIGHNNMMQFKEL